jgi:2-phosphosulfolactate phosphatase
VAGDWALQEGYGVRFDWGIAGSVALATVCPTVVVVDVLRFTTAVDVAVGRRLSVIPSRWRDEGAAHLARSRGAVLADGGSLGGPSLSPASLDSLAPGTVVVLPSPNGATCALEAAKRGATVVAACLRNAAAVASWLEGAPGPIGVIACGEHWPDGALRPSLEDLLGAGALVSGLRESWSPEADAAARSWSSVADQDLETLLLGTASGRELTEKGFAPDVAVAAATGASSTVPVLRGDRFVEGRL